MEEERGPSLTPEQALSLAGAGDRFQGGPVSGTAGWCRLSAGTLGLLECPHPGRLASPGRGIQRERVGGSLDVFHEP